MCCTSSGTLPSPAGACCAARRLPAAVAVCRRGVRPSREQEQAASPPHRHLTATTLLRERQCAPSAAAALPSRPSPLVGLGGRDQLLAELVAPCTVAPPPLRRHRGDHTPPPSPFSRPAPPRHAHRPPRAPPRPPRYRHPRRTSPRALPRSRHQRPVLGGEISISPPSRTGSAGGGDSARGTASSGAVYARSSGVTRMVFALHSGRLER